MKRILILAAATAVLCSCGNKNAYLINGDLSGIREVVYLTDQQNHILDSATVKSGKFRFRGSVEKPEITFLCDGLDKDATFHTPLFLEPGTIRVADNAEDPSRKRVTGTPTNDAMEVYSAADYALGKESIDPATSEERKRTIILEEWPQLQRSTVDRNRDNLLGVILFAERYSPGLSGTGLLDEIAQFSEEMQQTDILVKLKEVGERKLRAETGQKYKDITQANAAGNPVTLRSVVENPANKYVLVEFWASWCVPCMHEVPYLKKTYDTFHEKGFEIYGVSFDSDRDRWLGARESKGLGWIQVCALQGRDNQAAKDYAVQGIPANFLVAADGTIVAKNLRGDTLYRKIGELLAE